MAATEALLRLAGHTPAARNSYAVFQSLVERDSALGWKPRPGRFLVTNFAGNGEKDWFTVLKGGVRISHPGQWDYNNEKPKLVLTGGSFTQGFAVGDEDTFAWKLQEIFPEMEVVNFATLGYGTYQSLLKLEQALPSLKSPRIVLYGFIEHHEERNVLTAEYLKSVYSVNLETVNVPYVKLEPDGTLKRCLPEHYPDWPLARSSALVALAQDSYARRHLSERPAIAHRATEMLILEMKHLAERFGARFAVVMLNCNDSLQERYSDFFRQEEICCCDCSFPLNRNTCLLSSNHPSPSQHTEIALHLACQISRDGLTPN